MASPSLPKPRDEYLWHFTDEIVKSQRTWRTKWEAFEAGSEDPQHLCCPVYMRRLEVPSPNEPMVHMAVHHKPRPSSIRQHVGQSLNPESWTPSYWLWDFLSSETSNYTEAFELKPYERGVWAGRRAYCLYYQNILLLLLTLNLWAKNMHTDRDVVHHDISRLGFCWDTVCCCQFLQLFLLSDRKQACPVKTRLGGVSSAVRGKRYWKQTFVLYWSTHSDTYKHAPSTNVKQAAEEINT